MMDNKIDTSGLGASSNDILNGNFPSDVSPTTKNRVQWYWTQYDLIQANFNNSINDHLLKKNVLYVILKNLSGMSSEKIDQDNLEKCWDFFKKLNVSMGELLKNYVKAQRNATENCNKSFSYKIPDGHDKILDDLEIGLRILTNLVFENG